MTTQESPKPEPPRIFGVAMAPVEYGNDRGFSHWEARFGALCACAIKMAKPPEWLPSVGHNGIEAGRVGSITECCAAIEHELSAVCDAIAAARQSAEGEPKP